MKISLAFVLPALSLAFSPSHLPRVHQVRHSPLVARNEIDDACESIVSTTEDYVGKADNLILKRVMRVVDHAPMLYTLKALTDKAGISASLRGVTSNPGAFGGLATALNVPTWCFNVWTLAALCQAASAARSILASDGNELSQNDITANTAANVVAARAIGSANPLRDTLLTALVSGYALRQGDSDGAVTIHKASMQLISSFTTVTAVLGLVSAVTSRLPLISGQTQLVQLLGVASYYVMATREGNGTVKKAVNAGIAAGMVFAAVSGGLNVALNVPSLLTNVGIVGLGYVAYESVNRVRLAVFA